MPKYTHFKNLFKFLINFNLNFELNLFEINSTFGKMLMLSYLTAIIQKAETK